MNSPEKKVLHLAFGLFVVGVVVRFLPWGLPSIEQNDIAEKSLKNVVVADSSSKLEYSLPEAVDSVHYTSDTIAMEIVQKERKKAEIAPKLQIPVHVNYASEVELCTLKGVGPKLAEKIIAFREAYGPFKTPEDLQKVPGIGKKKLESVLQWIIFD